MGEKPLEEMSKSTKVKSFNIGTLNVQGCKDHHKQYSILEDAINYNLQVIGITETHLTEECTKTIAVKKNNNISSRTYEIFFGGIEGQNIFSGTGIAIESSLNKVERVMPEMLEEEGLYINKSKTEKYRISKHGDNKWKKA